jgi:LytS/YehU family sensor histidine kinase
MSDVARLDGACQALCCYLFGILPLEYLRPRLRKYHRAVTYAAAFGGAFLGASMGQLLLTAGKVNDLLGGVHALRAPPPTGRVVALSFAITISALLLMLLVRTVIAEAEVREHALAEAAALAKAHALQSQINPHFFFNTLTTVSAMADLDSRAAKELVGQLAELFRYTLSCSRFDMVTLAQELEFVRNYLLIERARFRRRLSFEMPDGATEADVHLPGLTLQPIVENAIRHGISRRREGGTVKIGVERIPRSDGMRDSSVGESVWVVSVANQIPFPEAPPSFDEEIVFRPGHALANTRERLALAFRGRAKIEFVRDGEEWVKVALTLPGAPQAS